MRQKSLLLRLLAVVTVMILAPSLLTFLVFLRTVPSRMEEQSQANADFYVDQVAQSIGSSMELIRDLAFHSIGDAELQDSMINRGRHLMYGGRGALERVVGSVAAYQATWNQHALDSVFLFRRDGQFVFYSPAGGNFLERARMNRIYQSTEGISSARTLFRPRDAISGKAYFLLDYKNIDNLDLLGKLIMELDMQSMVGAQDLSSLYPDSYLLLTSGDSTPLYSLGIDPDEPMICPPGHENVSEFSMYNINGQGQRFYHVHRDISPYELRLDILIPEKSIYNQVWETNQLFLVLTLLIVLLTVCIGSVGYHVLLSPMRSMELTLNSLALSDYKSRMAPSGYRELVTLEHTFNAMADNLEASFQDAYQKGIQLQESESRLLAAQINPHFIFNVLETINMRCVDAGLKDISRMVTDLAQLLRGNIGSGSGNPKITFQQELNYIRYYMDLQKSRFGDKLNYTIEYEDEEILQYLLPRLSVQPLVENAVVHGLEPRRGMGHVSIQIWEEDDSVCVRVEDDGVGFDPDHLDLSEQTGGSIRHNHIALPNILRRLHLIYGDAASLEIHSVPDKGTSVLLTLPIDR